MSKSTKSINDRISRRYNSLGSNNSSNQEGEFWISLDEIKTGSQCRKTFTPDDIQKREQSLLKEGQLSPLILISTENGKYIEDGELTWRAAKKIVAEGNEKWNKLKACLSKSKNTSEIRHRSLLHHLHNTNLNSLDRAEAIMLEIEEELQLDLTSGMKLLNNLAYTARKNSQLKEAIEEQYKTGKVSSIIEDNLSKEQIDCLSIFFSLQCHPLTFINTDMRFTILDEDLKFAIRNEHLLCSFAKEISKLSSRNLPVLDKEEILELRRESIKFATSGFSLSELGKWISSTIKKHSSTEKENIDKNEHKALGKSIVKDLSALNLSVLPKTQLKSLKSSLKSQLNKIESQLNHQN